MSLHKDIEKATCLNWVSNNAKFVRLQGLSQAAKDRKMNERKVKKPRNINLMEDNDNDSSDDGSDNFMYKTKSGFDQHASISAAIKEVNGGIEFSNKHLEKYWLEQTLRTVKNSTKEEKSQNSRGNHVKGYSKNQSENLNNKDINTQLHKLRKNAAIMGIVNIKKTSLEDLIVHGSSNKNLAKEKNKGQGLYEASTNLMDNDDDDDDNDNNYNNDYVEAVPHDEEEGVFIHPLQKGINIKAYKGIDFTLPRKGKKTKITPKTYFLNTAKDDDSFGFIKKIPRN